jgi:hypothetical protein
MNRAVLLAAVVCTIAPGAAQKVRVDFDHTCDFSRYRTFRWVAPPEQQALNQLMQERVVSFVEEALAARRLKPVKADGDLLVSYRTTVTREEQFTTFSDVTGPGWGWGWGWQSGAAITTVQPYLVGTLIVDLTDARKQRLIFEGVASETLSSRPERNTKKLAASVRKIFDKYPPR